MTESERIDHTPAVLAEVLVATCRDRVGYADGASDSGVREAKRLLRRAAIDLSAG